MKDIRFENRFKKDVKLMAKRGMDLDKLWHVVSLLQKDLPLSAHHCDHALTGSWRGYRDLHIEPDWILIYANDPEFLQLSRTGTHSDLF